MVIKWFHIYQEHCSWYDLPTLNHDEKISISKSIINNIQAIVFKSPNKNKLKFKGDVNRCPKEDKKSKSDLNKVMKTIQNMQMK